MKKILILVSTSSGNKEKLISYLQNYFKGKCEVVLGLFSDLVFEIEEGKVVIEIDGRAITDFDLIYFRNTLGFQSMTAALSIYLEGTKVKFFDRLFLNGSYTSDKFTSLMRLAVNGLPIVPTFLCSKDASSKTKEKIIAKFGFPIVAKEVTTQRMQSIFLLKSLEDFAKLPEKTIKGNNAKYLFQQFVDFDKEFRLLVLGDKVAIVHTKTVRNNTGFQVGYFNMAENPEFLKPEDISAKIKDIAIKAANALHIQIAGVDICREKETGKAFIFEVNRGPGFEYDTSVSPELSKIAEFFASEMEMKIKTIS